MPRTMDTAQSSARQDVVDVLRGLAVLGMAWVHVVTFSSTHGAVTPLWTQWLVVGQARTLFTVLFGAGFALQLARSRGLPSARGPVLVRYARRLIVLWLVFGVFCDAILGNDVLLEYAVFGLALPFVYDWKRRSILIASAVCFVIPAVRPALEHQITSPKWAAARDAVSREHRADDAAVGEAYAAGRVMNVLAATARRDGRALLRWRPYIYHLDVLGLMLIGLLVVREGVLGALPRHRRSLVMFGCLAAIGWGLCYVPQASGDAGGTELTGLLWRGAGLLFTGWLALAYGAFILALWGGASPFHARARRGLGILAPLGRMALTWFILHQLLLVVLFTPLGLNATFPASWRLAIWIALAVGMIAASGSWLRYMNRGPFEWAWRALAELRLIPIRRIPQGDGLAPALLPAQVFGVD